MNTLLDQWANATAKLPWGAQRVLHTTLESVANNGVHLVHGADYRDGKPCLINAAGTMLSATGGKGGTGLPTKHFGEIVNLFDRINADLQSKGVNDVTGYVSPLAAEILLRHFAPLKDTPANVGNTDAIAMEVNAYIEPSDAELAQSWLDAMSAPAPSDLNHPATSPVDGFNKDFIKATTQHAIFSDGPQ